MYRIRFRDVRDLSSRFSVNCANEVCRCLCMTDQNRRQYLSSQRDKSPSHKFSGSQSVKKMKLYKHSASKFHPVSHRKLMLNKRPNFKEGIKKPNDNTTIIAPVAVDPISCDNEEDDIGTELAGKLNQEQKAQIIRSFYMDSSLRLLASQHKIEGEILENAMRSFRKYCVNSKQLPVELHVVFRDLVDNHGHVSNLFPFFLEHTKTVYPHLDCMEDLQKISDLSDPSLWYPLARSMQRKIIFHAGPTNSGKTYHALKRFMESKSGVYCGPLRLLAMEVFDKCRDAGVDCDLITGETRNFAKEDESASDHTACTVEMANLTQEYDVAVIDEIQMIGDIQRGSSWTRALLGIAAKEVHVCGEERAISLVQNLLYCTGDSFEVRNYERLTSLTYLNQAVGSFNNIKKGDCIVCFSKKDIFKISNILSAKGYNPALIYGDLPPGTKIVQSRKFNDPDDPTDVLVATDAIGMGLNLSIKRVIFYSLMKLSVLEDDKIAMSYLSTSQAKQIGGRAGRYKTQYEDGEVTTFWRKDILILKSIVDSENAPIEKAGMHPTTEMLEMFSYHLPKATLSNLLDIFVHVCKLDDLYFMCDLKQLKELGQIIEHIPLPLRTRWALCSSPLKIKTGIARVVFVKIATEMSKGMPITCDWLCRSLGAPFVLPKSVADLEHLEGAFDVVDIYLWLRYPDLFVDADEVRQLRMKLDSIIQTYLSRGMSRHKRSVVTDIYGKDDENLEQSPLQAYTPKPKPKTDHDKHQAFADAYKELERMEERVDNFSSLNDHLTARSDYEHIKHLENQNETKEVMKDVVGVQNLHQQDLDKEIEDVNVNEIQTDMEIKDMKKTNKLTRTKKKNKLTRLFSGENEQYNEIAGKYTTQIFNVNDDGNIERNKVLPNATDEVDTDTVNEYEAYAGMDEEELEALKNILTISKEIKKHKMEHESPVLDKGEVHTFGNLVASDKEIPKLDSLVHIMRKKEKVKDKFTNYSKSLHKKDTNIPSENSGLERTVDEHKNENIKSEQENENIQLAPSEVGNDSESVEQKLLRMGAVTEEMLEKLKKEWEMSSNGNNRYKKE